MCGLPREAPDLQSAAATMRPACCAGQGGKAGVYPGALAGWCGAKVCRGSRNDERHVQIDNKIVTAPCDGTVLPGVTRDSILQLLTSWGYEVEERHLAIDELMQAGKEGRLEEAFGTGTAAVISPVGELNFKGEITVINDFKTGELTQKLYDTLTGIQWGDVADTYGWTREVK